MNCFLIPHSLWPAPFRAGLYLIVGFFSFSPFFYSFLQFCISCCTILSFLLWCYLTQACWASLGLSFIFLPMTQHSYWSYYYMACKLLCPIFLLGILGSFVFLGHPWPICFSWASLAFFLILLSHELLLIPLGFLGPITLSFILGAHGLSINPLLSLLASFRAYCGPFLLFYIFPMGLLLLSLRAPLGSFASSRPILRARDPFILAIRT